MFIELTLVDGNRPWTFSWPVDAMGRSLDDSATLLTTRSGVTLSVVERPEIIAEIVTNNGGTFSIGRRS
jgi:hypothetical protein